MERPLSLRSIAPSVFLPAVVYEIGNGAIAPIIALTALHEGASASTAAFMVALLGVGQIIGDLPAGAVADRLGDRRAMVIAAGVAVCALVACALSRTVWVLGPALTVIGMANATYYLGRMSFLTEVVPVHLRARAMSTMGGSHRIGLFIGPFVGAAVISQFGIRSAYVVAIVAAVSAATLLVVLPEPAPPAGKKLGVRGETTSLQMVGIYRRLFLTLGSAVFLVGAVRAARQTVLPLWANHLGLSPEQTSLVFGIASAVDMAMFYPSGRVMDRFGRLAIALPSMAILGGSMILLPLTRDTLALTAVAMVMSFGNGIGAGIMATLGGDTAPLDSRTRYLAVWRLLGDSGNAAGPIVVSIVALVTTLSAGIVVIGTSGLLAFLALARWVPRYSPYATPSSVLAHRQRGPA